MGNGYLVMVGMGIESLIVSLLTMTGLIIPTPGQQALAGLCLLATGITLYSFKNR